MSYPYSMYMYVLLHVYSDEDSDKASEDESGQYMYINTVNFTTSTYFIVLQ